MIFHIISLILVSTKFFYVLCPEFYLISSNFNKSTLSPPGGSLTRSEKTKSLCNLSSLDMDDDMMTLLELEKPVSSAESVEDIRRSIDLENRGSAYMLPSGNSLSLYILSRR